jgi:BON domain
MFTYVSMFGLVRRATPLLIAGAAGAVLGRYIEARRRTQLALPAGHGGPQPVAAVPAPASPPVPEGEPDGEPEPEVEPVDGVEVERPSTVDFEALAGHPALTHDPPPAPPPEAGPEEGVRAALAEASPEHGPGVSVEVHDGVAYLRGEVPSPEAITAMQRRAGEVVGVRVVENLLHLPGTPPPLASERR